MSTRDGGELYLITQYARGTPYAADLRTIAASGSATDRDHQRVATLARYLADLHVPVDGPARYRRAIRDLIGSGEGIYGVVDNYPADVPARCGHASHRSSSVAPNGAGACASTKAGCAARMAIFIRSTSSSTTTSSCCSTRVVARVATQPMTSPRSR